MISAAFASRVSRLCLLVALCTGGVLGWTQSAHADEFVDRVNATFKGIADNARTDLTILPVLHAVEAPPAVLRTQYRAALFGNAGPGWAESAAWAQKPAQKAILEALATVTKEDDRLKAFVFAQPYGVDGVSVDFVSKNMYTELGDPPLLAAARHLYMPAMEYTGILVHVEATRLLEAGDLTGGLKVLNDWLFFCRQMSDRPMVREKKWAMESMRLALERMRDLVYTDFRSDKRTTNLSGLREVNTRLRDRRGFMQLERIEIPEGDFIAREQLVNKIMDPATGRPSAASFGQLMARVSSTDRPLRLFSGVAYWDSARENHANLRDTQKMLKGIGDDWRRRWRLSVFDRFLTTATEYRRQVQTSTKYAVLMDAFSDVDSLFGLRQQLRTEIGGTRMAIGVYGFFLRQKTLPRALGAVRPEFIDAVDKDPFSRREFDLQFFVPERDTTRPGEDPKPHTLNLYPPAPFPVFSVNLGSDQFVIYSVGPDDGIGSAVFATQERVGVPGDYLLFPPTLSLYRQRLLDTNELK